MTALRWLAFGDLGGSVWGVAWLPGRAAAGHAVLRSGAAGGLVEVELDAAGAQDDWRLRGDGLDLLVSPAGAGGDGDSASAAGRMDQPAQASGGFTLEGTEHRVDCPGWRALEPELLEPAELDSLRLVAAWFDDAEGLAVLAARPRKSRGQEDDRMSVALYEAGSPQTIVDSRLSTTYGGEGAPTRAGLELWISQPTEEPGALAERPHRVAGEATAGPTGWSQDGLGLGAQPFRWHSHGREGVGAYVLGRPA